MNIVNTVWNCVIISKGCQSTFAIRNTYDMKNKQLFAVSNFKTERNSPVDKFNTPAAYNLSVITSQNKRATIIGLNQRLVELEEINMKLEQQAKEHSNKLAEVISTNAKFLSILAHDLRSPFSSIIGALELLKDSYNEYDIKEVEKYLNMATHSANGALTLLDNLLSWTVAQNKATLFNPVKIDLHDLLSAELESINITAARKLISLNNCCPYGIFLTADVQMVETVLRNLLNNAVKYSFIGGDITVRASEVNQFVEVIVEDNGIGITHKANKMLFNDDVVRSTRGTSNEIGTGLGLILCKEFIEKHGGSIHIESESGKGSKIIFTLPKSI